MESWTVCLWSRRTRVWNLRIRLGRSASGVGKLLEFENLDFDQINHLGYLGLEFGRKNGRFERRFRRYRRVGRRFGR